VVRAPQGEVGLCTVESADPVLCPPGPWAQFHSDAFEPPPDARVLGRTAAGVQGFALERGSGRVVGWQFHAEVTAEELARWLDRYADYVRSLGFDPDVVRGEVDSQADALASRAYALTDAALEWLRVSLAAPVV
jgi:GMP synthase (glutamine-hydrolysing)